MDIFENTEKYPTNNFYKTVFKIMNFGFSREIPEKIGYYEVSASTFTNMIPVMLLSPIAVWNSVWGFPYKFVVELLFAVVSIIMFVLCLIFPDKVNLFEEDIRSEEGFKKFYLFSKIPILLVVGIIIHLFF